MDNQDRLLLKSILSNVQLIQQSHKAIWAKLNSMDGLHTEVKLLNARIQYLKEFEDSIDLLHRESDANKAVTKINQRWQYALAAVLSLFVPVAIAWFIRVNADLNNFAIITNRLEQQIAYVEERLKYSPVSPFRNRE